MFAFLLFCLIPHLELPITEYHDTIEINTFYGDDGYIVFSQVIWRDYNPPSNSFDIVAWRLLEQPKSTEKEKGEKVEFEKKKENRGWCWNPTIKYHEMV